MAIWHMAYVDIENEIEMETEMEIEMEIVSISLFVKGLLPQHPISLFEERPQT